jgi:hypothetical protein
VTPVNPSLQLTARTIDIPPVQTTFGIHALKEKYSADWLCKPVSLDRLTSKEIFEEGFASGPGVSNSRFSTRPRRSVWLPGNAFGGLATFDDGRTTRKLDDQALPNLRPDCAGFRVALPGIASGTRDSRNDAFKQGDFSRLLDPGFTLDSRSATTIETDGLGRSVVFGQIMIRAPPYSWPMALGFAIPFPETSFPKIGSAPSVVMFSSTPSYFFSRDVDRGGERRLAATWS